eukprot:gene33877-40639_t
MPDIVPSSLCHREIPKGWDESRDPDPPVAMQRGYDAWLNPAEGAGDARAVPISPQ